MLASRRSGPSLEALEDRMLLSLALNNVEDLTALAISAVQNVSVTQNVATFKDTDATAVASDFAASIDWSDGSESHGGHHHRGRLQRLSSNRHAYLLSARLVHHHRHDQGPDKRHLYATNAFNQTNLVSSVAGTAGVTDASLINPWGIVFQHN